jgi:capsular polysaccharide biosynthesis protein/Mrp family chromosome partitioning ATPase
MDMHNILLLIWRRLWLILLAAGLTGTAVYLSMSRSGVIPQYSSTAVIAVGGDMYQNTQDAAYMNLTDIMIANYLHMAQLQIVTQAIVENLGLSDSPEAIAEMLDVSLVEGTNLLTIQATYANPETAAAIANEVIQQFNRFVPARSRNFILVLEPAHVPTAPDRTAVLPVLLTAFTAALLTGSSFFFREYLKHPFYDERDVTELLKLPTLIHLNRIAFSGWHYLRGNLLGQTDSATWWSLKEACRQRLTQNPQAKEPIVLVVSPENHFSRALVATQLARVWADSGQKTLLLDMDAQRPDTIQHLLNDTGKPGQADLLSYPGKDPARHIQTHPEHQQLQWLIATTGRQRPSIKQLGEAIESLAGLSAGYSVMVVSAPSPALFLETVMMARRAALVLLVVDARHTGYRPTAADIALLTTNGVYVDGVVLADLGDRTLAFAAVSSITPYLRRLGRRHPTAPQDNLTYEIGKRT